jgi:site-specific DNA-methyltransferase (adenine-specific)
MITIGEAELHHMDCMEYMAMLPDKAFDLAIVDPPYFELAGNGNFYGSEVSGTGVKRLSKKSNHWEVPNEEYFSELLRVSSNQIIWGCNYYAKYIPNIGRIIWDKKNDTSTFSNAEIASQSFSKGVFIFRHLWNGMCQECGEKESRIHPTQKPVKLYEWLLTNYAKQGQRILDTHLGSGSSAIAANNLGFDFVGMELDADYFAAACKRIEQARKQERLFT